MIVWNFTIGEEANTRYKEKNNKTLTPMAIKVQRQAGGDARSGGNTLPEITLSSRAMRPVVEQYTATSSRGARTSLSRALKTS